MKFTTKNSTILNFGVILNIIIRIECILLKFHWGMKALIELHFQHEALRFIENVLRSTLSYPNETSKECIQFLNTKEKHSVLTSRENINTPEALKSLHRSPGYKKNQLVLCKNYVLQW